jgi:hypothetical protein
MLRYLISLSYGEPSGQVPRTLRLRGLVRLAIGPGKLGFSCMYFHVIRPGMQFDIFNLKL